MFTVSYSYVIGVGTMFIVVNQIIVNRSVVTNIKKAALARQIKVRVWDTHQKKMIYDPQDCTFFHGVLLSEGDSIPLEWTGYKDKFGAEIYEGDIVMYTNPEADHEPLEVVWNHYAAQFQVKGINRQSFGEIADGEWFDFSRDIVGNVKIVGNVYENPISKAT